MKDHQTYGQSKFRHYKRHIRKPHGPRPLNVRPLPSRPSSKLPFFQLAVFIAVIAGVTYFVHHPPLQKLQRQDLLTLVQNLTTENGGRWDRQFPGGYKLIVFERAPVFTQAPSTLPRDFKMDWENMSLQSVRADPTRDRPESLKLLVPLQGGVHAFQFPRQPGTQCVISRHDRGDLVVELAADYGERVVLIFGLQ